QKLTNAIRQTCHYILVERAVGRQGPLKRARCAQGPYGEGHLIAVVHHAGFVGADGAEGIVVGNVFLTQKRIYLLIIGIETDVVFAGAKTDIKTTVPLRGGTWQQGGVR